MQNIRNFCIIAHIDHGKSTLADRFLEITGAIPKRKMKAQYLDQMELERERGITIKMAPVRMVYHPQFPISNFQFPNNFQNYNVQNSKSLEYILNLIDTPGHSDFSYEVSRALAAVEGAILLVDATQGIQAQTLSNFRAAEKVGLKIIGAVNKIDLLQTRTNTDFTRTNADTKLEKVIHELADLIDTPFNEIHLVSGKTGEGVEELLRDVVAKIPPPLSSEFSPRQSAYSPRESALTRALIFDSFYDNHKGIIASVRVFDGVFSLGDEVNLIAANSNFKIKEIGLFAPELKPAQSLKEGEIGYLATGIKDPEKIKIGDTVIISKLKCQMSNLTEFAFIGYKEPKPVVFVSFYPEDADEYELLKTSLQKLKLNDSSIMIAQDQNEVLGRGFKLGFLGRLHFEITAERLKREFNLSLVTTFPSVEYKIKTQKEWSIIINPQELPDNVLEIWEPMIKIELILPHKYLKGFFVLQNQFRIKVLETETLRDRVIVKAEMPLQELMSDFDVQFKSETEGYGSFSYELSEYQKSDILRVDILVSHKIVPGLSRFLHKSQFEKEARRMVSLLKELLPKQQFSQPIQASAAGRIIAREDIPALRKDVTGYLYGGDRTRKMKLWKKQKRGKKKLEARAAPKISPEVFMEILKKS